ncbi:bacteriocin-like protein [Chryseobacterium wanjuense]
MKNLKKISREELKVLPEAESLEAAQTNAARQMEDQDAQD